MAVCDNCGNDYHRSFELTIEGETLTFDCFECAIARVAPHCGSCDTPIIGHGIEGPDGNLFCCAHCASAEGVDEAVDHVRA
jgi:hypothetical protein